MKLFAFTMDLESDYSGCTNQSNILKDLTKIEEVLSALNSLEVKITVFTVGRIFEEFPEVVKIFEKYNCEFEAHSYSHDLHNPDTEFEIQKSKEAYFNYFKKYPKGYRAPRGKISKAGIAVLEKYGFLYDASIFPSYFPNPFKYLFCNKEIHCLENSKLLEIPVTPFTPFRLTLSSSYIKLFGINFYLKMSRLFGLPDTISFDSHLHDLIVNESSFEMLSPLWKFIYSRNKYNGIDYCVEFLTYIRQQDYQFCYLSDIYEIGKRNLLKVGQDI